MASIATNTAVDRDGLLEFLRPRHRALLITARADGAPQASPLTCGVDDAGRLVMSTYPERAKTRNARRDPRVSVVVLSDEWNGPWVQVDGDAEVIDPPESEQGPQTPRGHERRAELLAAARRVFERTGFLDARVADIVAEARVAQGTFYSYFDSKDAIFRELTEAVVARMLADFRDRLAAGVRGASAHDRIREGVRQYVEVYRPNARMLALMEQVGSFTDEMRDLRLRVREEFLAWVEHGMKRQQAAGEADPAVDTHVMVEVLGAMMDHTCYIHFALGKPFDERILLDTLTTVWSRALAVPPHSPAADQR